MAWLSAYDEQTRDAEFLTAPYELFRRQCADSPRTPNCNGDTVAGLCQRHLLHIWKFLYSLYKTESELPDCPINEVQQVLRYVICELNFAALSWAADTLGIPAVIHCFQRLKQFIQYLKGKLTLERPREAEQTLDFYFRKQLPSLKSDLSSAKVPPSGTEVHLVALVQRLHEFQRESFQPPLVVPLRIPGLTDESPSFYPVDQSSASEPVTPLRIPAVTPLTSLDGHSPTFTQSFGPIGDISTKSLLAEMCGQQPSSLSARMQKYRPVPSHSNVNFSIYKDSPQYSGYSKQFPGKKSIALDGPLPQKVSPLVLEDHGNLEQLDQGKWLALEQAPRSGGRPRNNEKTLMKSVTMRTRVDSRATFDPIFEEPERQNSEIREDPQGEKMSDHSSEIITGEDAKYKELRLSMQNLASLSTKEILVERIGIDRKTATARPVMGRKAEPRVLTVANSVEKKSEGDFSLGTDPLD